MLNKKSLNSTALTCALLALGVCIYLVQHHFDLSFGQMGGKSFCSVGTHFDCDSVNISRFSELFGVPVALWGAFTFAVEILFLFGAMFLAEDEKPRSQRLFFLMTGLNVLFSIYLAGVSTFILKTYCLFCIGTYILSAIMFYCGYKNVGPMGKFKEQIFSDLKSVTVILLFAFIPVGAFITNALMKDAISKDIDSIVSQAVDSWAGGKKYDFYIPDAPTIGASSPKLKLIVFSDFECPHCRRAAPSLHAFVNSHKNEVQLIYQSYPLDASCNPRGGSHKYSCLFAKAALCGNEQGKFQEVHDYVFENQESLNDTLVGELKAKFKLDGAKFDQCMKSAATDKLLADQIKRGDSADLQGTPTIFANGQLLPYGYLIPILEKTLERVSKQ